MKEDLILIRYGAYGDLIFMSAVLPYLLEKYTIRFETNTKGMQLFYGDPRFKSIGYYEPWRIPEDRRHEVVMEHWEDIRKQFPGARILNFFQAMEGTGIVPEWSKDALLPQEERAKKYGINFYEQHFEMAGIPFPEDFVPQHTILYDEKAEEWAKAWREKHKDEFIMLVVIAGSTMQKVFPSWLPTFCQYLIDKFPKMRMYLFGDSDCADEEWEYRRTKSLVHRKGRKPIGFKQSLLMAKYADYVFGPETGLLVGAGMWGTPKTALMTGAHKDQFAKYTLNDYSVQSNAPCSPCYRTCYTGALCEKEMFYNVFPRCTVAWDYEALIETIGRLYHERF